MRLLQRLQSALGLAAAGQCIAEPGMTERKAGAQLHRFPQMPERELGTPPSRVAESDDQVTPGVFIVERDGLRARSERLVGKITERLAGVQIEHAHIGPSQQGVGMGIAGVSFDRLQQQLLCPSMRVAGHAPHLRHRLHDQIPGVDALRRSRLSACGLGDENLRCHRADDAVRDLVLKRKDISQLAIVFIRPQMIAVDRIDQLAGHAHAIGGPAYAALQDVPHAELGGDVADIDGLALIGKGGVAGDDEEPALPGQAGDDVFGEPVREVFLIRIVAHVLERQDRNRRFVGQRQRRSSRSEGIGHEGGGIVGSSRRR